MKPTSFKQALSLLLLVPVIAMALLAGILAYQIRSLQSSAAWVDHSDMAWALSRSRSSYVVLLVLAGLAALVISVFSYRIFRLLAGRYEAQVADLAAQHGWLDTTLRSIGDAVIACDPETRVVFMNGVAEKLTGWTEQEARGRALVEVFRIFHEETRTIVQSPVEKVCRLGTIAGLANHTVLVRKDGSEIAIEDSGAPIRDAHGSLIGVVMVLRDISERRTIERALRQSEAESRARAAELETVMNVVPAIISIAHDPQCERITGSRFGAEFLQLPPDANVSSSAPAAERPRNFRTLREGKELAPEELPVQMAAASGREIRNAELTILFQDGSCRDILGNAAPLFGEDGGIRGAVGAFVDITERKRTEDALRKSEKLALVGRMAASISHEINNPLESVTNLIFLLQNASSLEQVRKYAILADEELKRVCAIVTETLRFSRQASQPAVIKVPELLETALSLYRRRFSSAGIHIESRYEESAPLRAYDGALRQVFINLLANALDATRAVGTRVMVRQRQAWDWRTGRLGVRVTVADTGHGMDSNTRKRIFEPFFSTRQETGTGLGLWLTKEIVEKHHGRVSVRSSQAPHRHGTVFAIFIPFDALEQEPRRPASTKIDSTDAGERWAA